MKTRHLEVFDALIEAGSVSRAAERLNLTQPAVSIALGKLETDLGFKLFHREKGFFAPTKEALQLSSEVSQGLLAFSRIEQRADEIRTGSTGSISIATNGVLAVNFLPRFIVEFQRENPGIRIEVIMHSSRRIASWISGRHIDIGFIDTPVPVAGLDARLFQLECVCIMHEDDPLTARQVVTAADLEGRSVVHITGDHMVDRQLDALVSKANVDIRRTVSAYYFAIVRNIVAQGKDIALIDPINGTAGLSDGVTWRAFKPSVYHETAMITSGSEALSLPVRKFIDLLTEHLKEY